MPLPNAHPKKWVKRTQTRTKHRILKKYMEAWFPILGSKYKRLVVVDGFAGRGWYADKSDGGNNTHDEAGGPWDGSPLLILKTLLTHTRREALDNVEFVFLFIEKNEANWRSLRDLVDTERSAGFPKNVTVQVENKRFDEIETNGLRKYVLNPVPSQATFLFIDPFGYTGFPMTLLESLSSPNTADNNSHKIELFINFQSESVDRFNSDPSQQFNMERLFGIPFSEILSEYSEDTGLDRLHKIFTSILKERGQFRYAEGIAMRRENNLLIYHLVYVTRHLKGLDTMRKAIWEAQFPEGLEKSALKEIREKKNSEESEALIEELKKYFENSPTDDLSVEEIKNYVLEWTQYHSTHVHPTIRKMKKKGWIELKEDVQVKKQSGARGSPTKYVWKGQTTLTTESEMEPETEKRSPVRKGKGQVKKNSGSSRSAVKCASKSRQGSQPTLHSYWAPVKAVREGYRDTEGLSTRNMKH